MMASVECGINLESWKDLEIGQIVETIISKANVRSKSEKQEENNTVIRKATQEDWDRFSI